MNASRLDVRLSVDWTDLSPSLKMMTTYTITVETAANPSLNPQISCPLSVDWPIAQYVDRRAERK